MDEAKEPVNGNPEFEIEESIESTKDKCRFTLVRYNGTGNNVDVPEGITEIGKGAFRNCETIRSVTLPEGVEEIGEFAFSNCVNLETVTIPQSTHDIVTGAFFRCRSLKTVRLSGVEIIGFYAFFQCASLQSVEMPRINEIGNCAFYDCRSLRDVLFPDTLKRIQFRAFFGCKLLREIDLPPSVRIIEEGAFHGCTGLRCALIPDSVQRIGRNVFYGCDQLTPENVILPKHLKHRMNSLFRDKTCVGDTYRFWDFPEEKELYQLECTERGFYTGDVWGLDDYIPDQLASMLELLSEGHHTSPVNMEPEEWDRILQDAALHFRNASEWRNADLDFDLLASVLKQTSENPQLREVFDGMPPELRRAYEEGRLRDCKNQNKLLNRLADIEMKAGFDILKEHLWELWD